MILLEQHNINPELLETLAYRGFNIRFNWDAQGQFVYTTDWPQFDISPVLNFGSHNWDFKADMQRLIDNKLDTLWQAESSSRYWGAKWAYYNNRGYRDLRLTYFMREILVIPILETTKLPELPELEKLAFQQIDKILNAKLL